MLSEKEWLLINEIIKEIYATNSLKELGDTFLPLIRRLVPFKAAVLTLVDEQLRDVLYSAVGFSEENNVSYNNKYVAEDFRNAIFTFPKSMSYCDADLINEDNKKNTALYTEWLEPMGAEFSGGIMIKVDELNVCCINIYRDELQGRFEEKDLYILDLFIGHLENIIAGILVKKNDMVLQFESMSQYDTLTRREKEILPLIVKGYSNEDISEECYISSSTSKKHIYSIMRKYGVTTRIELIKLIYS